MSTFLSSIWFTSFVVYAAVVLAGLWARLDGQLQILADTTAEAFFFIALGGYVCQKVFETSGPVNGIMLTIACSWLGIASLKQWFSSLLSVMKTAKWVQDDFYEYF